MAVALNRLMSPFVAPGQDFTGRLPPGSPGADPNMVAQPYADPGYAMPNPYIGNLNQAPGQVVGGALPAGYLTPQQIWLRWLQQQRGA